MTAKSEPLSTIREISDDIWEQIHPVIQRRGTAGLHRALACFATRSASTRARRRPRHRQGRTLSSDDQLSRLATIGQPGPRQTETPNEDPLAPWADPIYQWLTGDRLQVTRIHELQLGRGCPVSYQSPRGFIQKRNWSRPSRTVGRLEDSPPGKVAELDFGQLGLIHEPETGRRRTAGRWSWCWAIPATASSGPPSVRRWET